MSVEIVPLAESHFEGLRGALDIVAREKRYLAFTQAPAPEQAYAFYRNILTHDLCQYLAILDGVVVGWCDILPTHGEACAHIGVLGIGLVPSARGRGIGQALMQAALATAWAKGLSRIELTVRTDNVKAKALYDRMGFSTEGVKQRAFLVDGVFHDSYSMALLRRNDAQSVNRADGAPAAVVRPNPTLSDSMRMNAHLAALGIEIESMTGRGLRECAEATDLECAETGSDGREHLLIPAAAQAWRRLRSAAHADGITLLILSAFRSIERQAQIVRRKLDAGTAVQDILTVCAPPGFSEHHSGRAVDVSTPGSPALEVAFDRTRAYAWLMRRGGEFGYRLSYPMGNSLGYQYEPWHWCFHDVPTGGAAAGRGAQRQT